MFQERGNEITLVMPSTLGASIYGNCEERSAPSAEFDCKVRGGDDTLNISAVFINWMVAAYISQFPDCWDVKNFVAVFSDGHNTRLYDRNALVVTRELAATAVGGRYWVCEALDMWIRDLCWT